MHGKVICIFALPFFCVLLCAAPSRAAAGFSLSPTLTLGAIENQTAYRETRSQSMWAIGLNAGYRRGYLLAGTQMELGRFDGEPASSAAAELGASIPTWNDRIRADLRTGFSYNGYLFTHWYGHNSLATQFNHFLSPFMGGDVEMGKWRLGGEYLFDSHLVWKARIGYRVFGG